VWKGVVEGLNTTFLEPENGHVWRGCIYGRNDDAERCVAVGALQPSAAWCLLPFGG